MTCLMTGTVVPQTRMCVWGTYVCDFSIGAQRVCAAHIRVGRKCIRVSGTHIFASQANVCALVAHICVPASEERIPVCRMQMLVFFCLPEVNDCTNTHDKAFQPCMCALEANVWDDMCGSDTYMCAKIKSWVN